MAVHAHGADGIKRAVRAGVDSIEHGTFLDDEGIELMKQRGTWLVPTITAGRRVADKAKEEGFFPELVRPKAAAIGPLIQQTFAYRQRHRGQRVSFRRRPARARLKPEAMPASLLHAWQDARRAEKCRQG